MPEIAFRKEALERLTSPDQLDERVALAPVRSWLALAGLTLLVFFVAIWAIFSTIPVKLPATGVLLLKGPVFSLSTPDDSYLIEWKVSEGDVVQKGQLLAVLSNPELEEQLRLDTASLEELRRHYVTWQVIQKKADQRWQRILLRQATRLKKALRDPNQQIAKEAANSLIDYEMELTSMELESVKHKSYERVAKLDREWAIKELQRRVEFLETKHDVVSNLRANHDGIVVQIQSYPPAWVKTGETLILFSPIGDLKKDLIGFAFVDSMQASSIVPGQKVEISLAGVKIEQTGLLMGKVKDVSRLSLSEDAIRSIIHIPGFAKQIIEEVGFAPHLVKIELVPDLLSPTGYYWTGFDPKKPTSTGSGFHASIYVDDSHPIDYVVPIFERIL